MTEIYTPFNFDLYVGLPCLISIIGIIILLVVQFNVKSEKEDDDDKKLDLKNQKFVLNILMSIAGLIGPVAYIIRRNFIWSEFDYPIGIIIVGGFLCALIIGITEDIVIHDVINVITFVIALICNGWIFYDSSIDGKIVYDKLENYASESAPNDAIMGKIQKKYGTKDDLISAKQSFGKKLLNFGKRKLK